MPVEIEQGEKSFSCSISAVCIWMGQSISDSLLQGLIFMNLAVEVNQLF